MIVDFSVKNYLSIKDEVTLSMLSNGKSIEDSNVAIPVENGKFHLYTFSAIYGPNASGKSNLIKALADLRMYITNALNLDEDRPNVIYKPYRLDKKYLSMPTGFEIEFITDGIRYRYVLELMRNEILKEELYFYPESREAILFIRRGNEITKWGSYFTGKKAALTTLLNHNKSFIALAASSTNEILKPVYRFFRDKIDIHVRMDSSFNPFHRTSIDLRNNKDEFKKTLLLFLESADLDVKDVILKKDENAIKSLQLPEEMPIELKNRIIDDFSYKPYMGHQIFDNGKVTDQSEYFNLQTEESTGTLKMYDLAGELIHSLQSGSVIVIDEFNSGLHSLLNKFIIELFLNPRINKKNAQLIISTHDTCVMDLSILKREQIWFTDKSSNSGTELYSMNEFDKNQIRDFTKYGKQYLDGRFKAVPATNLIKMVEGLF